MEIFNFVLIILSIVVGFFIGKFVYDKIKWGDKKRILDSQWKLEIEKIKNNYENQILEIKGENEKLIKNLSHHWELKYTNDLKEIKEMIKSSERFVRMDAVKRSKRTLLGKLWEQVSPYLPKFPFKPSDMKFLGSPIDFIIFDGASENDIQKIIFLEIKSGGSKLSPQELKLKKVIEEGKVYWKIFNIDKPEEIKIEDFEKSKEIGKEISPNKVYDEIEEKIKKFSKDI
jgi:predicted Holliday junction resolvase-like endonuclease